MNQPKYYAGIGSRATPLEIQEFQTRIATRLEEDGWLLSSGGAEGADQAFENGLSSIAPNRIILPWSGFENKHSKDGYLVIKDESILLQCEAMASTVHPVWDRLKPGPRKMHARNVNQILGEHLDSPVKFVLYWAPVDKHGVAKGGTRTAVVLAQKLGIPTFNMLDGDVLGRLERKYL